MICDCQATRLLLDVELKAPYVIIPERSTSLEALIVDLGHVTIRNQLAVRDMRNEIGIPAVMDHIHLNLEELRLCLAVIVSGQSAMDVQSERSLINPLTFQLSVVRNLSTAWYIAEPDVTLDAKLGVVSIVLSHDAYVKSMQIVLNNLEEGKQSGEPGEPGEPGATASQNVHSPNEAIQSAPSASPDLSINSILQLYGIHIQINELYLNQRNYQPEKWKLECRLQEISENSWGSLEILHLLKSWCKMDLNGCRGASSLLVLCHYFDGNQNGAVCQRSQERGRKCGRGASALQAAHPGLVRFRSDDEQQFHQIHHHVDLDADGRP